MGINLNNCIFHSKFISMDQLHAQLSSLMCFEGAEYGYIFAGHGRKGKQKLLITSEDLSAMYDEGKQIRRQQAKKRSSPNPDIPPSKQDKQTTTHISLRCPRSR